MSYCRECGAEVRDGTKFCPNCGTQVFVKTRARISPAAQSKEAYPPAAPSKVTKQPEAPLPRETPAGEAKAGRENRKPNRNFLKYGILSILIIALVVTGALASMEGQTYPTTATTQTTTPPTTTSTSTITTSTRPFDNRIDRVVLYESDYPAITKITYVNKDGVTITDADAYAGLVVLLVKKDIDRTTVAAAVSSHAGELVMGVPICGIYWARVAEGGEAGFISSMLSESFVKDVFPCFPVEFAQEGTAYVDAEQPSGWFWDAYDSGALDSDVVIIDAWTNDGFSGAGAGNGQDHGAAVSDISTSCSGSAGASKSEVDVYNQPQGTGEGYINSSSIVPAIALAMINATDADRVTAINLSIGYKGGLNDGIDRHGSDSPEVANIQEGELRFLEQILHGMETMGQPYLDHVLISIAAGNMGVDLTKQLGVLKDKYPSAWGHVIIAGGLDGNNERIRGFNTSENPDDIIYAQMPSGLNGTSFAAPQFTCLATALAAERPDLTSWEIKEAILEAAPVISTYRTKPTLAAALAKANELFPEGAPIPDITGTWTGTYTAIGKNSYTPWIYNDGGDQVWTIASVSDHYFSGTMSITGVQLRWDQSGEVAGYASCTGTVSGYIYGSTLDGSYTYYVKDTGDYVTWHFEATLSGNTITYERSYASGSYLSFTLTKQGS